LSVSGSEKLKYGVSVRSWPTSWQKCRQLKMASNSQNLCKSVKNDTIAARYSEWWPLAVTGGHWRPLAATGGQVQNLCKNVKNDTFAEVLSRQKATQSSS
jgi:hypothetical protein